ncbi:hypothetical protein KFE25_007442 [Diacronema lutheri]|uniref:Uncharacterized protein n=1 Tax=Diacronema lutheri TaxID=2081491 RepID=A0A8J6CDT1_DIALT|nr:hypothetical protein KFE25_007442 [Diacronema lutheri]
MEDNLKQLRQLKENVKSQWAWVDQATAPARSAIRTATANDEDNWLRSKVRSTRLAAESALASAQEAAKSTADTVAGATSSVADSADGVKARALEIRRQNPAMLVAAVTVLAIAPAYRSGPRALFRNAIVGGGASAFVLYPEFISRTAPYVDRASLDISKHANRAAERLGLIKGGDE